MLAEDLIYQYGYLSLSSKPSRRHLVNLYVKGLLLLKQNRLSASWAVHFVGLMWWEHLAYGEQRRLQQGPRE